MRIITTLLLALLLVSCGAISTVDYDAETDFSGFTSYQFYSDIDSGLSQLDDKRIMMAIDSSFQKRGFKRTYDCKFYVDFVARESISNSRNSLGIGIGSGGGNVGVGVSGEIPIGGRVINQQLTIEITDATIDQKLVWQVLIDGELKENTTPEQKEAYYIAEIDKALKKFPPKKK